MHYATLQLQASIAPGYDWYSSNAKPFSGLQDEDITCADKKLELSFSEYALSSNWKVIS